MKTHQDITTIDTIIHYAEMLFGIRFTKVKINRYSAPCPLHADTKDNFMVYVNKKNEVRFHCFGACQGDWGIYDLIMLRNKIRFKKAQQVWATHLGEADLAFDTGAGPSIPEPGDTPEPDDTAGFVEPKRLDAAIVAALKDAADFYHDLLMSNENRFKPIWEYLGRRGVEKEIIRKFNIGFAPPYSHDQYQGRALIDGLLPRFETDHEAFNVFTDAGLLRLLNDNSVKEYGYYCRQIDFNRKDPFSRNYGDSLAGRIVFPIYDADARLTALMGRRPDDRGVRWLKHQTREVPLSHRSLLYGIEKAEQNIRQYRTIILVEGIFDYFAFYNLLQSQGKAVVVSTLGTYVTPEAATLLKSLGIAHFIVAFDWDELGRNGIERMAAQSGGWVYYLGGPVEGQTPYDFLKPVVKAISGFSLGTPGDRCAKRL